MRYLKRFRKLVGAGQKIIQAQKRQSEQSRADIERMFEFIKSQVEEVCKDFARALGWRYRISGREMAREYRRSHAYIHLGHGKMCIQITIKPSSSDFVRSESNMEVSVDAVIVYRAYERDGTIKALNIPFSEIFYPETYQSFSKEWLADILERCYKALISKGGKGG